ncbi:hypothetical protein VCUG_01751, partial [Vavraia culicis subsp. floridensis]
LWYSASTHSQFAFIYFCLFPYRRALIVPVDDALQTFYQNLLRTMKLSPKILLLLYTAPTHYLRFIDLFLERYVTCRMYKLSKHISIFYTRLQLYVQSFYLYCLACSLRRASLFAERCHSVSLHYAETNLLTPRNCRT